MHFNIYLVRFEHKTQIFRAFKQIIFLYLVLTILNYN